jgi:hypothetical protein
VSQTNCPVCNFPDSQDGYHYTEHYRRGTPCGGCGYHEVVPITVTELQISQRCIVNLDARTKILVFLDWTLPTEPKIKSCHQRQDDGRLTVFEPSEIETRVILYYAKEVWAKWLKMT